MSFPLTPTDGTKTIQNNIKYVYSELTNSWRRDYNNVLDQLAIGSIFNYHTATNTYTGALTVQGGVGIGGVLYASTMYSNGNEVLTTASNVSGYFGVSSIIAGTGTHINTSTGDVTIWSSGGGGGGTGGTMTLQDVTDYGATTYRAISITNTTPSTGTVSGALTVVGGLGIGGNIYAGGTGHFSSAGVTVGESVISSYSGAPFSSNVKQRLDTFSTSTIRSARYMFQIVDTVFTGTNVHVTEMTVFHDDIYVYINEYGIASSSGVLGVFDASLISGIVTINFTPNYYTTAMVIKGSRTAILN